MNRVMKKTKKVIVGVVGGFVTLLGLILVPYPGPGWLVVFGGLAILATEFEFAARWLDFARAKYDAWAQWLSRQYILVKVLAVVLTCLIVLLTFWLLNGLGVIVNALDLPYTQFQSPLFK